MTQSLEYYLCLVSLFSSRKRIIIDCKNLQHSCDAFMQSSLHLQMQLQYPIQGLLSLLLLRTSIMLVQIKWVSDAHSYVPFWGLFLCACRRTLLLCVQ
jgi:hypothetical protein